MTKMNFHYILRHILPLALFLLVTRQSGAISPLLCEPRIGDRLGVEILSGVQAFTDSAALSPVLYGASVTGRQTLGIWASLPDDSVSFAYLTLGPELCKLTKHGNALNIRFEQRPGNRRTYESEMPYGAAESNFSRPLSSAGTLNGLTHYRSAGRVDVRVHYDLLMVTLDGDTLWNVVCMEHTVNDTLYYANSDTCRHTAVVRRWYAPGYRYPLSVYRKDEIRSLENEILDSSEKWYACGTDAQDENITDDPVNEEIRRTVAEHNSREPERQRNTPIPREDNGNLPSFLRRDGNGILVSGSFSDGTITGIILCDIKGRVYDSHKLGEREAQYRIGLSQLAEGEIYILYVQTDSEHYVYRFKA